MMSFRGIYKKCNICTEFVLKGKILEHYKKYHSLELPNVIKKEISENISKKQNFSKNISKEISNKNNKPKEIIERKSSKIIQASSLKNKKSSKKSKKIHFKKEIFLQIFLLPD